jgi:hypothetical protein
MMTKDDYQHFVCIVAGDNPELLMEDYNKNKESSPRIIYKYKDVDKIKNTYIKLYENMYTKASSNGEKRLIEDAIDDVKTSSNEEFFEMLCDENEDYYFDDNTGNIMTDKNQNGKWSFFNLGKAFSIPFLTFDGREVFQTYKKDIDWSKIHLSGKNVYERVWEMCMENSKPNDEHEKVLFDNMKDKTAYFNKFETKDNYVVSNTAFWGYAFLSEINGWVDAEDEEDQFAWMSNYYDVFIKNLPDDTLLTIYECKK